MQSETSPQAYFGLILQTVVGQAFAAAGFRLEDNLSAQMGGLYRYVYRFETGDMAGMSGVIEFQMLHYAENAPARFRVTLIRTEGANPAVPSRHPLAVRRDLSALVVEDFGVAILPSATHWWHYRDVTELGRALAEAGHLAIGYGMPWLSGDLVLPEGNE